MKILFSPSEEKNFIYKENCNEPFSFLQDLLFGANVREDFVKNYLKYLKDSTTNELSKILGMKNISLDKLSAASNLHTANTIESILLYNGIAFKALDIRTLPKDSLNFLFDNVLIFSNLFGCIRANDKIPYYKLKQGETFFKNSIFSLYDRFKEPLFEYLKDSDVLDLRAEFYIKAFALPYPHTKAEFYKNNKKVSHQSKHYRGLLLRNLALNKKEPFKIRDIKQNGFIKIIQYEVD